MFTEALNIAVLRHSVRTRGRRQFKPSCERDMGGIHLITRFSQLHLAVRSEREFGRRTRRRRIVSRISKLQRGNRPTLERRR